MVENGQKSIEEALCSIKDNYDLSSRKRAFKQGTTCNGKVRKWTIPADIGR